VNGQILRLAGPIATDDVQVTVQPRGAHAGNMGLTVGPGRAKEMRNVRGPCHLASCSQARLHSNGALPQISRLLTSIGSMSAMSIRRRGRAVFDMLSVVDAEMSDARMI
jgi:hypothetical protein